jgi:hypothetical protein
MLGNGEAPVIVQPIENLFSSRHGTSNMHMDEPASGPVPTCRLCGSDRYVRRLWAWSSLTPETRRAIDDGRAILGLRLDPKYDRRGVLRQRGPLAKYRAPARVCLNCEPFWWDVHVSAIEVSELQAAKEEACAVEDFEAMAALLTRQDELEDRIFELIARLKD